MRERSWKPSVAKSDGVRVLCSAPDAGLTQLVEYLFCNQTARGSSPRFSTNGDDVGKSYSMRTPQRSSRLANPCTPLTEVKNAGLIYAAYNKGGSLQSKANSQVQDLHAATIDIHLVFHHILSRENTSGFGWGYFSCKYGLKSNRKFGTIDVQFLLRLLRIKPQGSFFIFSADSKMAIWEYHKSDCNQSRGVYS